MRFKVISRYPSTISTSASSGQTGPRFRCIGQILGCVETKRSLPQSRIYRLTTWWENEEGKLKKYDIELRGMSRLTAFSGFSCSSEFPCSNENFWFLNDYSNGSRKLSIETLKKEIKSVVLEKHKIENRDESITDKLLAFLDYHAGNFEKGLTFF